MGSATIKYVFSPVQWNNNSLYLMLGFPGLNKVTLTKHLVSLGSRKDSVLTCFCSWSWADGKRRDTKGTKLSKGRRDVFHRGQKNSKRIEKFLCHVMDKAGQTAILHISRWPSPGPTGRKSVTHRGRQCSVLPPDGSIEPLPFSPLGSIAASASWATQCDAPKNWVHSSGTGIPPDSLYCGI